MIVGSGNDKQVNRVIINSAFLAATWPMFVWAHHNDESTLEIRRADPIYIAAWNGSGGLTGEDDYCIRSFERIRGHGSQNGRYPRDYDVAAYGDSYIDGDGDFALENGSGEQLKVSLSWRGNSTGGSFVTLRPNETSGDVTSRQNGAVRCNDSDAAATIRIDISAATLASASAGTYAATFRIDAWQFDDDGSRYPSSGPIYQSFTVTLPELVQITNLDNIDLGSFDGVSDIIEGDDICIFRNGFGNFRIKANGGPGDGDPFLLSNGTSQIPYQVALKDDSMPDPISVTEAQWLGGLMGHGSKDCGGGNNTNASVQVTTLASDMATATSGSYLGTLYLTVEPE
ncbi:hypothetical protein [Microbulbifer taiwanensis]|uniref:Uncharacterized protein n=1 Tax=Microbulbifer taiwanensis TaxID=986746 RepID=A0ABW1YQB4_9GAMM|nr:hypothetical protein [Microbulbifer taiwanensis]